VVYKKIGLALESEKTDDDRVYRIVAPKTREDRQVRGLQPHTVA
jgi:hypothetical protein